MKTTRFYKDGNYAITAKVVLPKIDYDQIGNKVNLPEIEININYKKDNLKLTTDLKTVKNYYTVSMSGLIWDDENAETRDIVAGGQILDEIGKYFPLNHNLQALIALWGKYHLNDMNAGTKKQNEVINNREFLKAKRLYIDNGYVYGSQWLVSIVPENDLREIHNLIKKLNKQTNV